MRSPRALRIGAAILGIAAALAAGIVPAEAHYVYDKQTVYGSSTNCTGARAEISHGSGGGYSQSDVYSWYAQWTPWGDLHCGRDWDRPKDYLKTKFITYKKSGGTWGACAGTGWYYNQTTTHQYAIYYNYGSTPWCGSGELLSASLSAHRSAAIREDRPATLFVDTRPRPRFSPG